MDHESTGLEGASKVVELYHRVKTEQNIGIDIMNVIPVRVISKNVRYATSHPSEGEEPWTVRKEHLVSELQFNSIWNDSALLCCQEVLHEQLQDILRGLRLFGSWDYVGWGRDDGKEAGEYSPIFFRPEVWELLEKSPVWLSPTPRVPSKDPDAASIRILTRAKLKHKGFGYTVVVYCTHLDHASSAARKRAAEQILGIAREDSKLPIILAGDFNSEEDQEAYQTIIRSGLFADIGSDETVFRYGNLHTFTSFAPQKNRLARIDYVFCTPASGLKSDTFIHPKGYAVLPNRFEDGMLNSDHCAVVADVLLCSR